MYISSPSNFLSHILHDRRKNAVWNSDMLYENGVVGVIGDERWMQVVVSMQDDLTRAILRPPLFCSWLFQHLRAQS